MKSQKSKMNYGTVELSDDDLDMKKAKIRITTMIDYPIYELLKAEAAEKNIGYQTLLNEILSERFFPKSENFSTVRLSEEELEEIARRVTTKLSKPKGKKLSGFLSGHSSKKKKSIA
jgi:predicted DNA binding CopG/RHH family protein